MTQPEPQRRLVRVFRLNTGSCGGCDLEIGAAVAAAADIIWAHEPFDADVLLLTGPLTPSVRPFVTALLREIDDRTPIVAIGRCAIDGHPFGRGGLADMPTIKARATLDGCPPSPEQIIEAIRAAVAAVES